MLKASREKDPSSPLLSRLIFKMLLIRVEKKIGRISSHDEATRLKYDLLSILTPLTQLDISLDLSN